MLLGVGTQVHTTRQYVAAGLDLACVVLFVVIGRASHAGNPSSHSFVEVLLPYLVGLTVGWVALLRMGAARAMSLAAGVLIASTTWGVGALVRRLGFQEGVAFTFLLVSAALLIVSLVGWRALVGVGARRAFRA